MTAKKPRKAPLKAVPAAEPASEQSPPPDGLGPAGREVWDVFTSAFEADERELVLIALAARQADQVADLDRLVEADGLMIAGSVGQQRLHPAVTEARQGRAVIGRLLSSLAVPGIEEDEVPRTAAQHRAARAARSRWGTP